MDQRTPDTYRILTIPNILSAFRLVLAVAFAVVFFHSRSQERYTWAVVVLVLSGLTDFADGKIARHFHMVSELGKVLDPVADKITQAVVAFCLCWNYPVMKLLLAVLVVKECVQGLYGLYTVRRTGRNYSSMWCGKITTFYLYAMMVLFLLVPTLPGPVHMVLTLVGVALLIWSFLSYLTAFRRLAAGSPAPEHGEAPQTE